MRDLLLLSGGLDSVALAAWMRPEIALTVDYGQQPAGGEGRAASQVARVLGIKHIVIRPRVSSLGSGDMAGHAPAGIAPVTEWWPFRNQFLVTVGAMAAIQYEAERVLLGCVRSDDCHTDGTADFVSNMDRVCRSQEGGIRVEAPAIGLDTASLIRESGIDHSVLAWSHSCHTHEWACGVCRGCFKHREVMAAIGHDPY